MLNSVKKKRRSKIVKKRKSSNVSIESKVETNEVESGEDGEEIMEQEGDQIEEQEQPSISNDGEDDDLGNFEMSEDGDDYENPEKKQKKSGVLYFSYIPPHFNPKRLQAYFEKLAPGLTGRVYFERNKKSKSFENRYLEGWLEIKKKKVAKQLAAKVDNTPIGGKRRDYVSSMLWNIKYLSGFKWVHLVEQLEYEKAVQTKRMAAEVDQARRVAAHFEEQVEKGRRLKKLEEKVLKQGGRWEQFQRQVQQKKTIQKKPKKQAKKTEDDEVMKMIFAE